MSDHWVQRRGANRIEYEAWRFMESTIPGEKVVDIVMRNHFVDPAALMEVKQEAESTGTRLEKLLVEKKLVSGSAMALALSEYLKMPPIELSHYAADSALMELIPKEAMTRHLVVPIAKAGKVLTLAMGDPFDLMAVEEVHAVTGLEVIPVVAPEKQVADLLQNLAREQTAGLEDILRDVEDGDVELGDAQQEDIGLDEMLEGGG